MIVVYRILYRVSSIKRGMREMKLFSVIVPESQSGELKMMGEQFGVTFGCELLHMMIVNTEPPIRFLRILGAGIQGMIGQLTELDRATVYEGDYQQREDGPLWLK